MDPQNNNQALPPQSDNTPDEATIIVFAPTRVAAHASAPQPVSVPTSHPASPQPPAPSEYVSEYVTPQQPAHTQHSPQSNVVEYLAQPAPPPPAPTHAQPQQQSEYVTPQPPSEYAYSQPQPHQPQSAPQPQGEYAYAQPQAQGQYYAPARRGVPPWAWIVGGVVLLALIGGIVTLILVLTGSGGNAGDTARNFYQRMGSHDYTGARTLFTPELLAVNNAEDLKTRWENLEQQYGAKFQSVDVSNVTQNGDTATATANIKLTNGAAVSVLVTMRRVDGKWLIANVQ